MQAEYIGRFIAAFLAYSTPIILASVGEVLAERAGVVNIGLEGIILLGALFAVRFTEASGSPWIGLLGGLLVGAAAGLLHAFISVYLKGDQIVSGIGINIFALGFTPYALIAWWHSPGQYAVRRTVPYIGDMLPHSVREALLRVPVLGIAVSQLKPTVVVAIAIAVALHFVLHHTSMGLRIRAVGENPEAADALGISVERIQTVAVVVGASLSGLAGAFLSVEYLGSITKTMSAGRGFIALANVVFSKWEPLLALGGGMLFGFFDALAQWIQSEIGLKAVVPYQFLLMIPYIATLIVVSGVVGRARPPKHVGVPYKRE